MTAVSDVNSPKSCSEYVRIVSAYAQREKP